MKIPVEYLQVQLVAPGAPSALRLWLELFTGDEPTHSATDDDGDTSARGPRDGYWIDLHRVNDSINFFATPVERRTAHDPLTSFEASAWPKVLEEVIARAVTAAASYETERTGISIVSGEAYPTNAAAIAAYRNLGGAFALLPAGAIDARSDFTVAKKSTSSTDFRLRIGSQHRVGRRSIADPEGDYEASDGTVVSWKPHLGNVINVNIRGKADTNIPFEKIAATYEELAIVATKIWENGADALA